jgi:hypothetical protein
MMFLNSLTSWLRKRTPAVKTPKSPSTRLRLEELEDRIVPQFTAATYVNPTVQITPGFTVTETVTATVTTFPSFDMMTGQITPVPAGAFNPTSGNVSFMLNNQQRSAPLNANGQASATFQVPILAFFTTQRLEVSYGGTSDASGNSWLSNQNNPFVAPLYTNFVNLLLPGTLTFAQLTPQQVYAFEINSAQNMNPNFVEGSNAPPAFPTLLRPFYTANGETDNLGLFTFNYVDPGTINTVTAFGVQFPGSVAFQLGAYNGLTSSSSSSSG